MLFALATTDFKAPSEGADAFMRLTSTLLTACLIATRARVGGRFRSPSASLRRGPSTYSLLCSWICLDLRGPKLWVGVLATSAYCNNRSVALVSGQECESV